MSRFVVARTQTEGCIVKLLKGIIQITEIEEENIIAVGHGRLTTSLDEQAGGGKTQLQPVTRPGLSKARVASETVDPSWNVALTNDSSLSKGGKLFFLVTGKGIIRGWYNGHSLCDGDECVPSFLELRTSGDG